MQNVADILDYVKRNNVNVLELSRKTGIKSPRIYKWLDKKGSPKLDDAIKLQHWYKNLELLPIVEEPAEPYQAQKKDMPMQIIDRLSRAIEELVSNNTELTRNNTNLVNKVISSDATDGVSSPLRETKPILPDPTAEMPGTAGIDSEKKKDKQKDSGRN